MPLSPICCAAPRITAGLLLGATALTATAVPAQAAARPGPHRPAGGHAYRRGAVLVRGAAGAAVPASRPGSGAQAVIGATLRYGGGVGGIGVTTGHPRVYLVFWGSQWGTPATAGGIVTLASDPSGMAPYLQKLFKGLGTGGELWSGVVTQFCQGVPAGATSCPAASRQHVGYPAGGALAGVWADESGQAPNQASGHQLAVEAVRAAAHFGNSSAAKNRNAQYMIISPAGTHPDGFNTPSGNFCGWHDWNGDKTLPGGPATSPYGPIAFTNLPYITDAGASCGREFINTGQAGQLDGVSIVAGHEYAETLTDQNPPGGWTDASGNETADLCQWDTGPGARSADLTLPTGTFAMQSLFAPAGTGRGSGGTCEFSHAIVANGAGGTPPHHVRVTSPGRQHTARGSAVRLRIRARDSARHAALRFRGTGLPPGLRIGRATGLITGRPSQAGTFRVRIRVRDRSGAAGSVAFRWIVTTPAAALAGTLLAGTVLAGQAGQQGPGQWIVWADAQIRALAAGRNRL